MISSYLYVYVTVLLCFFLYRLIMKDDMDKIVSLSDGDRTVELQKYLSSLSNDQVKLSCPPYLKL